MSVFRGSGAVDVVSVNYYHRWSAEHGRMTQWVKASGRPFIISEWSAQKVNSPTAYATGAGFCVKSQTDRGLYYQNQAIGLLAHPGCVGWHWFKYGGDTDIASKGIVDRTYEPHAEFLDIMQEL